MHLSELSETALQANPVVLRGVRGATPLPDGTEAANRAAAASVLKAGRPTLRLGLALALLGIAAFAYNTFARRRGKP